MANSANENILDEALQHRLDLLLFSEHVRERVVIILEDLQTDIARKLADYDLAGVPNVATKVRRAKQLFEQVDKTIKTAYRKIDKLAGSQLTELADLEQEAAVNLINGGLRAELASIALDKKTLEVLAKDVMIQGSPAREWWAAQSDDLVRKFTQQVRMGYLNGETNDQIVRRIIGKATGTRTVIQVPQPDGSVERRVVIDRAGGIMSTSKNNATTLVRTAVQTVSNEINAQVYEENDDLVKGWALVVTLDGRTSMVCRGRAGGAWDFNGDPLPQSTIKTKSPGRPPYHMNCRTFTIPITKTWEELSGIKGIEEIPPSTRSSLDGQVPAGDLTYDAWLKTKDEAFQQKVLGPGRYDLWKAGKVSSADLIDQTSGRTLTLDELAKKVKGK